MKLTVRNYRDEDDYNRIRRFLGEVLILNDYREFSWHVNRFDYWRWHVNRSYEHLQLTDVVFLWEAPDGRIAAVLNPENRGNAFLHIHPEFRSSSLDLEMLEVAEQHLNTIAPDGRRKLRVWLDESDTSLRELVRSRGYVAEQVIDCHRRRSMSDVIPTTPMADGYSVRPLGGAEELPARSYLSWRAFHPDEPDDKYAGWEWYHGIQKAPLYRRDLDLVAIAGDGEFAAFCTVWFDEVIRTGVFEPVGTEPRHQRRGLARAVISEGLRSLHKRGAIWAYIASWNEATHRLYGSLGFSDFHCSEAWKKVL